MPCRSCWLLCAACTASTRTGMSACTHVHEQPLVWSSLLVWSLSLSLSLVWWLVWWYVTYSSRTCRQTSAQTTSQTTSQTTQKRHYQGFRPTQTKHTVFVAVTDNTQKHHEEQGSKNKHAVFVFTDNAQKAPRGAGVQKQARCFFFHRQHRIGTTRSRGPKQVAGMCR